MAVPILPRKWGEIPTLESLLFVLTVTLITGVLPEKCGTNRICGYGTRCDGNRGCVCLSDSHVKVTHNGFPNSVVYCFGAGVTECREKVCGYRAHCNTDNKACECPSSNNVQKNLKDTPLWYCVEKCKTGNSNCPGNTTCEDPSGDNNYRCYCSAGAVLSSIGQCLANSKGDSTTKVTRPESYVTLGNDGNTSDDQGNEHGEKDKGSQTLIIGLVAGIGGAVLLAVIALIVVFLARRRKRKRGDESGRGSSWRQPQTPHHPSVNNSNAYTSVVDPMPGPSGADKPAGPTVIVLTKVSVINAAPRPVGCEDVGSDFSVHYSTAKVIGEGDKRKTDTRKGLYSNHTIPANKAQQGKKNDQESSESGPNQYNTLHDVTSANGNEENLQALKAGSGVIDKGSADYAATYSIVDARGGNARSAGSGLRGDHEYDELKLPKV